MFDLQEQPSSSGTTCEVSVLKWRRKPMMVGLLLVGLAICLWSVCILAPFDSGNPAVSGVVVILPMWLGFYQILQLLYGRHTVEVEPEGIRFRSLVTARSLSWSGIDGIRFKCVGSGAEPLARTILLKTGSSIESLEEWAFLAGREPMLDAILRYWRPPVEAPLSGDWAKDHHRAEIRRYGLLGSACSLATIGTLSALKLTGVLAACFSWTVVVLVPIAVFLGGVVWVGTLLKRGPHKNPDAFHDVADLDQVSILDPSTIQSNPRTAFAESLFRRFLSPPPERLLPAEQIRELRHRMTRLDQRGTQLGFAIMLPLIALFTYLPYRVNLLFQDAAIDPVMDTRSREGWMWLLPGMFLGGMVALIVSGPVLSLWYGREELRLYSCYQTTLKGYDIDRVTRYLCGACMVFVIFGSLVAWGNGYVVDQNGIRFKPGLVHTYGHPYNDVRTIGVYRRFDAPIGVQEGLRIRITFREGPSLVESMRPSDKRLAEWLQAVEYISQRSGVPVEHGDMAPKE